MGRQRIIYPINPIEYTWDNYKDKYPIHCENINDERQKLNNEINNIKNKIFALVGSTPRDICNENDDPLEYIVETFENIIKDYKFITYKLWLLYIIENYEKDIKYGEKNNLLNTIDKDTNEKWRPSITLYGIYAYDIYDCDEEINTNIRLSEMLKNELMMYVSSTPKVTDDNADFENTFFNVRQLLDEDDGLEYYWFKEFDWALTKNNFDNGSYNSY